MPTLAVHLDHIGVLRRAGGGREPDPVHAAVVAELAGAQTISIRLREDRRDIQDRDVYVLKQTVATRLNLNIAPSSEMISLAMDALPWMCTLVPEQREGLTIDGGLSVSGNEKELAKTTASLRDHGVAVSLFIDPDTQQVKAAKRVGPARLELNAGYYAQTSGQAQQGELDRLRDAAYLAHNLGFGVCIGRGVNYQNIARLSEIEIVSDRCIVNEISVGHALISRGCLTGLDAAIRELQALM